MADTKQTSKGGARGRRLQLTLEGLKPDEERPDIAVTLVGKDGKRLAVAAVNADGSVELSESALKEAQRVLIGPGGKNAEAADPETLVRYRARQFEQLVKENVLTLPRGVWEKWRLFLRCVTGTVKLCRRSPWWFDELFTLATARMPLLAQQSQAGPALRAEAPAALKARSAPVSSQLEGISRFGAAKSIAELIQFPFRCQIICNGTIEVYQRTCCCLPWIIFDPRLPELIQELEEILRRLRQVVPFPRPIPNPPDPPPIEVLQQVFKDGALDERALNAQADLTALRSLAPAQVAEYVNARPYLRCRRTCGAPHKVAEGEINLDGRFSLCWLDWPRIQFPFCHDEYAYIVRQRFGPFLFTIYDGVAANIWFSGAGDADVVSYSPFAYACRDNGEPGSGAYVFLDLIGDTESWNLKTPNATAWNAVGGPAYNDGLLFPAANAAAALGQNLNRNMGGTLKLNYKFSEDMRNAPVGAVYYRIGISEADNNGNPVGDPIYLSAGLSWDKSEPDGMGGVNIVPVTLGPFSAGGQDNLFKIPYDADADWNAGQYHGYLNTADVRWSDPTKRHLVTLEVFNGAGTRLRPNGTPASGAPGAEATAPFTFRRRFQDIGPTANVPFAALTHMFWWDNQDLTAVIDHLNKDGLTFSEECLFLEGTANSTFGIGYRAYHPNELFQLYHTITWQRGLGISPGSSGTILAPPAAESTQNVGKPPSGPGDSPTATFSTMLGSEPKCAFTVFLGISSKTTDGDYLGNYGITRTGAFALEIA